MLVLSKVESSNIEAVGYSEKAHLLAIRFKQNSGIYFYSNVHPNTNQDFMKAESKGKFFNTRIRDYHNWTKLEI